MYENIFYAGVMLFIAGLIVTMILFIKNNIAEIIGDLTGFTAKRTMKNLQKEKAEVLSEVLRVTDILPVRKEHAVVNAKTVSGMADLFEIEEDITVLGGEFVSKMPTTVLSGFERRL